MTRSEEDYIKVIFNLGGEENLVSNKAISTALGISPSSVNEMIKKLTKEGYLKVIAYKGSSLTLKGLDSATEMVRRHRLWEVFLLEHLGYSWDKVHEEAESLEHVMSKHFEEKFYNYLGQPKFCPHGSPIPTLNGRIPKTDLLLLSDAQVGESVVIQKVGQDVELLKYLEKISLEIKGKYLITDIGLFLGPITLNRNEKEIVIGREASKHIYISKEKK